MRVFHCKDPNYPYVAYSETLESPTITWHRLGGSPTRINGANGTLTANFTLQYILEDNEGLDFENEELI